MQPLKAKYPHIWLIDQRVLENNAPTFERLLASDELHRADRFRSKKDRTNYVVTRGSLRRILGRYLNMDPLKIQFQYAEYGKPILKFPDRPLQFNLSHAHDMAILGISSQTPIGVDIEFMKFDDDLIRVAKSFFSEREIEDLLALPKSEQSLGFFNCWTRKESFIKAVGHGLSFPLDQFSVTLRPHENAALVDTHFDPGEKNKWTLKSLPVPQGYAAAFALPEIIKDYKVYRFDH